MALQLETGIPSIRHLQEAIRDKQPIEVKLLTGDVFIGAVIWQDNQSLCVQQGEQSYVVSRHAIAYIKLP